MKIASKKDLWFMSAIALLTGLVACLFIYTDEFLIAAIFFYARYVLLATFAGLLIIITLKTVHAKRSGTPFAASFLLAAKVPLKWIALGIAATTISLAAGIFAAREIGFHMSPPPGCHEDGIAQQKISPDRKWIAETRMEACGPFTPPETFFLILRRSGEEQNLSRASRILSTESSFNIHWIAADELVITLHAPNVPIFEMPTHFRDVRLTYLQDTKK